MGAVATKRTAATVRSTTFFTMRRQPICFIVVFDLEIVRAEHDTEVLGHQRSCPLSAIRLCKSTAACKEEFGEESGIHHLAPYSRNVASYPGLSFLPFRVKPVAANYARTASNRSLPRLMRSNLAATIARCFSKPSTRSRPVFSVTPKCRSFDKSSPNITNF